MCDPTLTARSSGTRYLGFRAPYLTGRHVDTF
jgi:hypothetical protein